MSKKLKHDSEWAKAKKICRLNIEDIAMAKELGFKPKSLTKSVPNSSQQWKASVKDWIRELHRKRFPQKYRTVQEQRTEITPPEQVTPSVSDDVDIPF